MVATKTGGSGGSSTRSSRKRTSTSARSGTGTRKRATSKPLIIDVVADKTSPTDATAEAASGLDEATAKTAGLAADAKPATKRKSAAAKASEKAADKVAGDETAGKPASSQPEKPKAASPDTVVPPSSPAAKPAEGVSPFFVFAAGLIGGLLALVLVFLANTIGLFTFSDDRFDDQASALSALQQRVATLETAQVEPAPVDTEALAVLQDDVTSLRVELEALSAGAALSADTGAVDAGAVLAHLLAPVEDRLASVEGALASTQDQMQALADTIASNAGADAGSALPAASVGEVAGLPDAVAVLQNDIATIKASLSALEGQMGDLPPELAARLDAMDSSTAGDTTRITELNDQVATLSQSIGTVEAQLDALSSDLAALAATPTVESPDRLARFAIALEAVETARDAGAPLVGPLGAALAAASFDPSLADALVPLEGLPLDSALNQASLIAAFDAAESAMQAAAPAREDGGLLGALEDRARQMVTIRAPEGSALLGDDDNPLAALPVLRQQLVNGDYNGALANLTALPADMQGAAAALFDLLQSRISLDQAIADARSALVAALAASDMSDAVTSQ